MEKTVQLAITFQAKSKMAEQVDEALETFYEYLDTFERGWSGEAQVTVTYVLREEWKEE